MLKKIGIAAVICSLGASSAFAHNSHKDRAYLGFDLQANKMRLSKDFKRIKENNNSEFLKTNLGGASLFAGYRWDQFGAELGYTFLRKVTYTGTFTDNVTTVTGSLSQTDYNTYLDGIYYHPLAHNFDLKALVGVGVLSTAFKGALTINDNGFIVRASGKRTERRAGIRLGVGAQYYFTDCLSTNLMLKYQTGNKVFKDMKTVALGFAWHI